MNILEYEEFLKQKEEKELPKEKLWPRPGEVGIRGNQDQNNIWAREYQQEFVGPTIRTGMTVGANESFMSQGRSVSLARQTGELTQEDRLDIMNAIVNLINNDARGMRYNRQNIEFLSRKIHSFVGAYYYRWFPFIRDPVIVCDAIPMAHEQSTEIRIIVDHVHMGTMGVNTQ